jgi:hypothetical protein
MNTNVIANQAKYSYNYKNLKLKLLNTVENIRFNKYCLRHKIIPNYVHVTINNTSNAAQIAKSRAQKIWIEEEIKFLYSKKDMLNHELYKTHLFLSDMLGPENTITLIDEINESLQNIIDKKKDTQNNKIERLLNVATKNRPENITCEHEFFPKH